MSAATPLPGTSDEAVGNRAHFTGTGTLLVEEGMLAEYCDADGLLFVQRPGVREPS